MEAAPRGGRVLELLAGEPERNFCVENGRFTIWRPDWKTDAHGLFEPLAEIEAREKDNWLVVAFRKRAAKAGD